MPRGSLGDESMSVARKIVPLQNPLDAVVHVPGSKSFTNRALVCAALAPGTSQIRGALVADDTAAMASALGALGAEIVAGPAAPPLLGGNIDLTVDGVELPRRVASASGAAAPISVNARQSGTTSRFLLAVAALFEVDVYVDGHPQLRARPMADGIEALQQLGCRVESANGGLPVLIRPPIGEFSSEISVNGAVSSQFLSGLLLAAPCLRNGLRIAVSGKLQSLPYVEMTIGVMRQFGALVTANTGFTDIAVAPTGYTPTDYVVEPDASAASYFWAAGALCGGRVFVPGLTTESLQGDVRFVDTLEAMGAEVKRSTEGIAVGGSGALRGVAADFSEISDTAQTLAALAPFASSSTEISGIGFIRAKEIDRLQAIVSELRRCGVPAFELADGVRIDPAQPHPAVIQPLEDHRMAMAFSLLGLRSEGIQIADPGCVAKTFPHYWEVFEDMCTQHSAARGTAT